MVLSGPSVSDATGGARRARVERRTSETEILLDLTLDGSGESTVSTGIGFFDHMLALFARHGLFDLQLAASGDLSTGGHHTVEDVGICLGSALDQALGDREGIVRYGNIALPMDESLALVAIDLSGRPYLCYDVGLPNAFIGGFDTDLAIEFFQALVNNARMTLHIRLLVGSNPHHIIEAVFKGFARALDQATRLDPRAAGVPSTKGLL
jgi:imidazoleglycerol-phosphate dehydratase